MFCSYCVRWHEKIAAALGVGIYFAPYYRFREQGLIESSNGLLRQLLLKVMALNNVAEEDNQRAVDGRKLSLNTALRN